MYKHLTHEQHLELAPAVKKLSAIQSMLLPKIMEHHGKSSKAGKHVIRLYKNINALKCELDNLYHEVTNDAQFKEQGHAYYGGKEYADWRNGIDR